MLLADLYELFNEADVIVGHNGDNFDIKKTNARLLYHGFLPPEPYHTIDTLKIARKNFKLTSNRLGDVAEYLGLGNKTEETHSDLWRACLNGDMNAWRKMKKYNEVDVMLLEKIYDKMKVWHGGHPNLALMHDKPNACPVCTSYNIRKRGKGYSKTGAHQRYQCMDCGKSMRGKHTKLADIR